MKNLILIITLVTSLFLGGCEKEPEIIVEKQYDTVFVHDTIIQHDTAIMECEDDILYLSLPYLEDPMPLNVDENEFKKVAKNNYIKSLSSDRIEFAYVVQENVQKNIHHFYYSIINNIEYPLHEHIEVHYDEQGNFKSTEFVYYRPGISDIIMTKAYHYFSSITKKWENKPDLTTNYQKQYQSDVNLDFEIYKGRKNSVVFKIHSPKTR